MNIRALAWEFLRADNISLSGPVFLSRRDPRNPGQISRFLTLWRILFLPEARLR